MVEFAIVAPILFAVLFGAVDGGFFMYARNTVDRAAEVGMNSLAAAGNADSADLAALASIRATGVSNGGMVSVSEVDVDQMTYSGGAYTFVTSGCTRAANGGCENAYALDGSPMWDTSGCADLVYRCQPWPPSARSIHASSASFVRLTIKFNYHFFAGPSQFSLATSHIFRLEPKDI